MGSIPVRSYPSHRPVLSRSDIGKGHYNSTRLDTSGMIRSGYGGRTVTVVGVHTSRPGVRHIVAAGGGRDSERTGRNVRKERDVTSGKRYGEGTVEEV